MHGFRVSGSKAERLTLYNAVQRTERAKRFYNMPDPSQSQITFELVELDKINIGESFAVTIRIKVSY